MAARLHSEAKGMQTTHGQARKSKRKLDSELFKSILYNECTVYLPEV